jgi:flagellar export protein FliJ
VEVPRVVRPADRTAPTRADAEESMSAAFRLGRVRRLQEQIRRLRQSEAEVLSSQLGRLRRRLDVTHEERERIASDRTRPELVVDSARLGMAWAYEQHLEASATRLGRELERGHELLRLRREAVQRSRQEERKLDRLKERHDERLAEVAQRHEDGLLDELSLHGFRRIRAQQERSAAPAAEEPWTRAMNDGRGRG